MAKKKSDGRWHAVPLSGSFMVTSILGFIISGYWVYPQSLRYGFSFMLIFALMFVASLVSMTKAPIKWLMVKFYWVNIRREKKEIVFEGKNTIKILIDF